jgi:titin
MMAPGFGDSGLRPGADYAYRVRALNAHGRSGASDAVTAPTLRPPATPSGLRAVASSDSRVGVSWKDVGGETRYRVERRRDGSSRWFEIRLLAADTTRFYDSNVPPGTYSYRVTAIGPGGSSAPSALSGASTE